MTRSQFIIIFFFHFLWIKCAADSTVDILSEIYNLEAKGDPYKNNLNDLYKTIILSGFARCEWRSQRVIES